MDLLVSNHIEFKQQLPYQVTVHARDLHYAAAYLSKISKKLYFLLMCEKKLDNRLQLCGGTEVTHKNHLSKTVVQTTRKDSHRTFSMDNSVINCNLVNYNANLDKTTKQQ